MSNFYEETARKKAAMPDDWKSYRWESKAAGIIVTGAVCNVFFKSGKRKGRRNWAKRDKSTDIPVYITHDEIDAFVRAWEADTGKCHVCDGTGQAWAGWSIDSGTKYRDCSRCNATGRAPARAA